MSGNITDNEVVNSTSVKTGDTLKFIFQLLTDSLIVNTSIKSMVYELKVLYSGCGISVELCDVAKFITKLEGNDTLEELTLNRIYMDIMDAFSHVEDCIQEINKTRSTKGKANLKVNISCVNF